MAQSTVRMAGDYKSGANVPPKLCVEGLGVSCAFLLMLLFMPPQFGCDSHSQR